jgi:2-polyprenyl-6-hydroxyphenyl methylase/3-demethylubiquinone-9 3-methyltransferase
VACTAELRRRYHPEDPDWQVHRGSVLDGAFMASLGTFDVVYAWGVLHHTGAMATALQHAAERVAAGGTYFIAIYNDQGGASRRWRAIKRLYNRLPGLLRAPYVVAALLPQEAIFLLACLLRASPGTYVQSWMAYKQRRGMSRWHDMVDWVGGYPFEVARPEEMLDHVRAHGMALVRMRTCGGGLGCNEFVARKAVAEVQPG